MRLVVATRNAGKLKEIRSLLVASSIEVVGLQEIAEAPEVMEDGDSFAVNAMKKAVEIARFSDCLTLADDSGLVVPALDGAPGIYSARYAGPEASDAQNNQKLLAELQGVDIAQPDAYFACVMALADPHGNCRTFEGRLHGRLLRELRGTNGFGYDPLFLVPEYGKTLAELSLEIKNRISHRGLALTQVVAALAEKNPPPAA